MVNGWSSAEAEHIAAVIVGRYKTERKGLPAIAITTDTSVITSIANYYSFLYVFDRQVTALVLKEDVVIVISTWGANANEVNAVKT